MGLVVENSVELIANSPNFTDAKREEIVHFHRNICKILKLIETLAIAPNKYLNSHDQLPVDPVAKSVRALVIYSRVRGFKSHRGQRFFSDL